MRLPYLLITVKAIETGKVPLSDMQNFNTVVDTLTSDEKLFLLNRDNLTPPIHMQLSHKQKTFSIVFFSFLKSIINFEQIQKKDDTHSWCIPQITDSEKCG